MNKALDSLIRSKQIILHQSVGLIEQPLYIENYNFY